MFMQTLHLGAERHLRSGKISLKFPASEKESTDLLCSNIST